MGGIRLMGDELLTKLRQYYARMREAPFKVGCTSGANQHLTSELETETLERNSPAQLSKGIDIPYSSRLTVVYGLNSSGDFKVQAGQHFVSRMHFHSHFPNRNALSDGMPVAPGSRCVAESRISAFVHALRIAAAARVMHCEATRPALEGLIACVQRVVVEVLLGRVSKRIVIMYK